MISPTLTALVGVREARGSSAVVFGALENSRLRLRQMPGYLDPSSFALFAVLVAPTMVAMQSMAEPRRTAEICNGVSGCLAFRQPNHLLMVSMRRCGGRRPGPLCGLERVWTHRNIQIPRGFAPSDRKTSDTALPVDLSQQFAMSRQMKEIRLTT